MKTIEEALEEEITRGSCDTCSKRYRELGGIKFYCEVTEEEIGSGNEYCELKPLKKFEQDTSDKQGFFIEQDGTITSGQDTSDKDWEKTLDNMCAWEESGVAIKELVYKKRQEWIEEGREDERETQRLRKEYDKNTD